MIKLVKDLRKGDMIRPAKHPDYYDFCDPATTSNFSSINDTPLYKKHEYESFRSESLEKEIFFVLEVVPQAWSTSGLDDINCKFLAATSRGICLVWVYADEAFEVIGE